MTAEVVEADNPGQIQTIRTCLVIVKLKKRETSSFVSALGQQPVTGAASQRVLLNLMWPRFKRARASSRDNWKTSVRSSSAAKRERESRDRSQRSLQRQPRSFKDSRVGKFRLGPTQRPWTLTCTSRGGSLSSSAALCIIWAAAAGTSVMEDRAEIISKRPEIKAGLWGTPGRRKEEPVIQWLHHISC